MASTLDIKLKDLSSRYFSEQIQVEKERLTIVLPESKKKLFYSKLDFCNQTMLTFDKLEQFITVNGGFIKDF